MRKAILIYLALASVLYCRAANGMPVNLAELGTASARDSMIGSSPAFAIDGDPLTMWNDHIHGTVATPSWLVVDLLGMYELDDVVLFSMDVDDQFIGFSNQYTLHVSGDETEWTYISSGILYDSDGPDEYTESIAIPESVLAVRYIKYEVVGGSHWAYLNEMQIYGSPVPLPSSIFLLSSGLVCFVGRWRSQHDNKAN